MNEYYGEPTFSSRMAEAFAEGGWAMYPLTFLMCLLPLVALVLLVVGIVSKKNVALPLGVGLLVAAFVPPALGIAAMALSRATAEEAIAMADPQDQATIRMAAEGELLVLSSTGTSAALCPGFIGCVLIGLGLARRPRFS
jgi:hypothetical protein